MSRSSGASGIVARAARRLAAAPRSIRRRSISAARAASDRLPVRIRRVIYAPIADIAGRALRRPGDHPIAAPARMVALALSGREPEAVLVATDLTADASPRTCARMARISMQLDRPDIADELLARVPASVDDEDPAVAALRSRVDWTLGRYRSSLARSEAASARHPDRADLRRQVARAGGELALLDPAWRPAIPTARAIPAGERHGGRILHLLSNSLPHRSAGYTVRAQQVARCQQGVGLDPRMVTRAGFPGNEGVRDPARRDVVDGVTYERIRPDLDAGLPGDAVALETARGMAGLIETLRPSVLQPATHYPNAQVALALGEAYDLPVVYEVRGFLEETWMARIGPAFAETDRYRMTKAVETASMRRATAVVTLSETMRADIVARGGIDPEGVVVIPNGVDVDRFSPGPRDESLAASLGIERSDTVVGYISTLNPYEGIDGLIEAVARLRRRGRRVRLLLVGDGIERRHLEAVATAAGLIDDRGVIFTGWVPHAEIERYYRTIDIFVVPRTDDRVSQLVTPLKPYEAMAMEKAVLVSAVGALQEMIREGETGRAFTPDDPDALADALDRLLDDPGERTRLGTAAREWVAANRTWAMNGRRYLELYERLGVA